MDFKIEIYEIVIFMLLYGGLFLVTLRSSYLRNKTLFYIKSAFLIVLYVFISIIIWFIYKTEEHHINNHSGYEPISLTSEAIFMILGLSIYSIILLLLGVYLKRKRA
ncbi:peptide ABC transporter permease [Cytobacillus sp. FJAT-54145]|uniref:Peptide ABC transporter permease n=1 Tax=Cytobacillus spartinae TaxID=3299023 RepID=A0ABW6K6K3_9BACI